MAAYYDRIGNASLRVGSVCVSGRDGLTPSLQIGEVETLPPGTPAYVTREGTDAAPVLNFGIPQGVPGTELTAGDGILIADGVIHAVGEGILINTPDGVRDVQTAVNGKQDRLTAGENVSINAQNEISAVVVHEDEAVASVRDDENDADAITPMGVKALIDAYGRAEENPYKDAMIHVFGDSQTENNGHKENPWNCLLMNDGRIASSGPVNVQQGTARSGNTIAVTAGAPNSLYYLVKSHFAMFPQLCAVYAGVNDVIYDSKLGTIDSSAATDTDTVYGALKAICETLHEKAPESTVVFITPTEQNSYTEPSAVNHTTVAQVCKAIKDVAGMYGYPVFDAHGTLGIYPRFAPAACTTDGLHLNGAGHRKLADGFWSFAKNIPAYPAGNALVFDTRRAKGKAVHWNGSLFLARGATYSCAVLDGVRAMSVDGGAYNSLFLKETFYGDFGIGWFAFEQADGSWVNVSPYSAMNPAALSQMTGELFTVNSEIKSPSAVTKNLWTAPASKPDTITAAIENGAGKIYFNDSVVYTVPYAQRLGFLTSAAKLAQTDGVTLTMAQ